MKEVNFRIIQFKMKHYSQAYDLWNAVKGLGISEADSRANIKKYLKRNPGCSFVALTGGRVVGTILGGHDGRRGYIHHVAVDPDYQKTGIGKALVSSSINELKKAGMVKCHIFVLKNNKEAKNFWSRINWQLREDLEIMSLVFE